MQAKLILTFERLSEADLQAKAGTIISSLTDNTHFPEPWLPQLPTLAQISAAYDTYLDAYHAGLSGDNSKIALRNNARAVLTDYFKKIAPYLEIVAQDNAIILASSGYNLRSDSVHSSSTDPLPAPSNMQVTHGIKKGSLNIRATPLQGAGSYELQTTQLDPSIEGNWEHQLTSLNCTHIVLEGLIPTKIYWLRLRGISRLGAGVWTEPVSIIID